MNKVIGFTTGVRDLFHIGHLNILKNAKSMCDILIVGVTSDQRTYQDKGKYPIIPYNERFEILEHIDLVDKVVEHKHQNELGCYNEYKFDIVFKGSDREGSDKRNYITKEFSEIDVKVIFFPYTTSISTTKIIEIISNRSAG